MTTQIHRIACEAAQTQTRQGYLQTFGRLLRATAESPPGMPALSWRRRFSHLARCSTFLPTFRRWYGNSDNPALQEALADRPSLVTCAVHPYLNLGWSAARRLAVISNHYAMLRGRLAFLRFAAADFVLLARLDENLTLRLAKFDRFRHEGELVLHLSFGERRLYSLAFTLGQDGNRRVAYVGAMQGLGEPDVLDTYRSLTHLWHGLRPRDLLLKTFQMLCRELGVGQILLVTDDQRICSNPYFESSPQVLTSYDQAWLEHGACPAGGGFARLSPHLAPRATADIPARKRALYRRRHEMLDALDAQIRQTVAQAHCPPPFRTTVRWRTDPPQVAREAQPLFRAGFDSRGFAGQRSDRPGP